MADNAELTRDLWNRLADSPYLQRTFDPQLDRDQVDHVVLHRASHAA